MTVHYLITADELGNYEVIAGGLPDFGPDGLYVVRNGIAVAVTAEDWAKADYPDGAWEFLSPAGKQMRIDDAQTVISALTRPADGAAK